MFYFSSTPGAQLIDGKKIAEDIRAELREQIQDWMVKGNNRAPQLTAILISDDPASKTYVNNKMKVMQILLIFLSACNQTPNVFRPQMTLELLV